MTDDADRWVTLPSHTTPVAVPASPPTPPAAARPAGGLDGLAGLPDRPPAAVPIPGPAATPALPDAGSPVPTDVAARPDQSGRSLPAWTVPAGLTVGAATTAVALGTLLVTTGPVLGHSWQATRTGGIAGLAAVAGGVLTVLAARRHRPRAIMPAVVTLTVLMAIFTIGAANTVVVDGRVLAATSPAAQVLTWSAGYTDDLRAVFAVDELLELEDAEARARRGEYPTAISRMRQVSAAWADRTGAPDPRLDGLAGRLATAAHFAAEALARREALLTSPDSALSAQLAANRNAFIAEAVPLGPELATIAEGYGVDIIQGPTE